MKTCLAAHWQQREEKATAAERSQEEAVAAWKQVEAEEVATVTAKEEEVKGETGKNSHKAGVQSAVSGSQAQRKARLKEAKDLYDEGLIDLADYRGKKAEILFSL